MLVLISAAASPGVTTDSGKGAYEVIVTRNVFGLKPPVVENPATNAPVTPPSNLELTGISTLFGGKQIFLNLKDHQGKVTAKTIMLGDPITDGIEVLSVDESAGEVRVRNRGVDTVMSFATHGPKITNAPAPLPRFTPPQAAQNPYAPPQGLGTTPAMGQGGMPTGFTDPNAGAPRAIPTRSIRVPPANLGTPDGAAVPMGGTLTQPQPAVSQEAQMILMEIERQRAQQAQQQNPNAVPMPPLPPTPLTPPQQ